MSRVSVEGMQRLISSDNRHRKSEKEEDEELLNENKDDEEQPYVFEESAPCMSTSRSTRGKLTGSRQRRKDEGLPSPGSELDDLVTS